MDQCGSEDGYVKQTTPDLPTLRIFEPRENTITHFSLNKLTEIVMTFYVTHSYMQSRPSRLKNPGPFDFLSKWKFTLKLRCLNVNT